MKMNVQAFAVGREKLAPLASDSNYSNMGARDKARRPTAGSTISFYYLESYLERQPECW